MTLFLLHKRVFGSNSPAYAIRTGRRYGRGDVITTGGTLKYEVQFGEGSYESYYGYSGVVLKNAYEENTDQYGASKWEVIGNVHENPDLLN